jgi:hypothetical protein
MNFCADCQYVSPRIEEFFVPPILDDGHPNPNRIICFNCLVKLGWPICCVYCGLTSMEATDFVCRGSNCECNGYPPKVPVCFDCLDTDDGPIPEGGLYLSLNAPMYL